MALRSHPHDPGFADFGQGPSSGGAHWGEYVLMILIKKFWCLLCEAARRAAEIHGATIDLVEEDSELAAAVAGMPAGSAPKGGPTVPPSRAPADPEEPPAKRPRPTAAKSFSAPPRPAAPPPLRGTAAIAAAAAAATTLAKRRAAAAAARAAPAPMAKAPLPPVPKTPVPKAPLPPPPPAVPKYAVPLRVQANLM